VVVALTTDRTERVAAGSELQTDGGPLVVASSRPHQDRWLVTFAGVDGREAAEALRGRVLRAEPIEEEGTLWVHELVGCRVVTPDGTARGVVESVQANPAADLLVLDTGALVPVVFVVGPPVDRVVTVDVPDGLFELTD
jgi:16S rRNA processing protein RimM